MLYFALGSKLNFDNSSSVIDSVIAFEHRLFFKEQSVQMLYIGDRPDYGHNPLFVTFLCGHI